MSFPSVHSVLSEHRIDPETANERQLCRALWDAFKRDLPLGVDALQRIAKPVVEGETTRAKFAYDRDSDTGKQLIRLLGTDAARPACERTLNVSLGIMYPCVVVAARSPGELNVSSMGQLVNLAFDTMGSVLVSRSQTDVEGILFDWFSREKAIGMPHVLGVAKAALEQGITVRHTLDPKSPEAKASAAILGVPVVREIFGKRLGVQFGFLNCHATSGGPRPGPAKGDGVDPTPPKRGDKKRLTGDDENLVLTLRDQIRLQATADC